MHFHFDFSFNQILWTLTFAAELVLLIVLLGRDRVRRFPWFMTSITLMALLMLVSRLLFGRMAPLYTSAIFLALSSITAIVGLVVLVEVARRAFHGASRRAGLIGSAVILVVAAAALIFWGPWPHLSSLADSTLIGILRTLQMFSDKGALLGALLGIELGIAICLFGRRYQGGWRSHPQQIAIGLGVAGLSQVAVRAIWQIIATRTIVHSRAEYEHVMDLRDRIYHTNNLVFLCALLWWIVWLWIDEPGQSGNRESGKQESEETREQGNAAAATELPAAGESGPVG